MNKTIRIAAIGVPVDYPKSLVPQTLNALGYQIAWTAKDQAELVIYGPFQKTRNHPDRFIPKPLRPLFKQIRAHAQRTYQPITLFHTGENLRHDHVTADFTISFDLAVEGSRHLRLPYWMEQIDWTHEGIHGMSNGRFGQLLDIQRLMNPLGDAFLRRPMRAAFFSSHLREPRRTLFEALNRVVKVDGYGSQFDSSIVHHSASSLLKMDVLQNYALNLCPENSMYPGYYTEKIPEAFHAGCLPVSWVDNNVRVDFNPDSFINMAPMTRSNFTELAELLHSRSSLQRYVDQALLLERPTLDGLKNFLKNLVDTIKT